MKALVKSSRDVGYRCRILEAVETVNQQQKNVLVEKLNTHFGSLKGKTIGMWGLAFKPRTDDVREAPSVTVARGIVAAGGTVKAYDPEAERPPAWCLATR